MQSFCYLEHWIKKTEAVVLQSNQCITTTLDGNLQLFLNLLMFSDAVKAPLV